MSELKRVGDIAAQIRGVTYSKSEAENAPREGYIHILRAMNITDHGLTYDNPVFVPSTKVKDHQMLKRGDIVVAASSGSLEVVGKAGVVDKDVVASFGAFCKVVRPGSKVYPAYLGHFFQTTGYRSTISKLAQGANINNLKNEHIDDLEIPLPPLDEQKRIAAVLDKADALRRQRQESLQLTEKLLQSVFIDMFGDPVRNTKNLPIDDLSNLAKLERGKFTPRPRNDPSYFGGSYPFIQTGDITRSKGRITTWTQTLNNKGARVSKEFGTGTVVIAIVGATLGETAIVETPVYCPDSIIGITPFPERSTSEFIEFLLRLWKPRLKDLAPDAARANLNLERLRPLAALAPDIEEQRKFSRVAKRLRELTLSKFEGEQQLDLLFSSIQQRAFRGELDLSRLHLDEDSQTPASTPTPEPETTQGRYRRPGRFITPPDIEAQMRALEEQLDFGAGDSINRGQEAFLDKFENRGQEAFLDIFGCNQPPSGESGKR